MEYISVKEASELWGIDASNIGKLCRKGKIEGAKIVGRNWLIPQNAPKPIDGRTRAAKEIQRSTVFRFPLYINFPVESFVPPLSGEEASLRQAQVDFNNCEFEKAKVLFETLAENAESIYVKICAHFYMCVLSAVYDMKIPWGKYYCGMILLLSADFPRKKEMELFLPWLDFIIGQVGRIPEKLNVDPAYDYHPSAWYLNTFLSAFNHTKANDYTPNTKCSEPFVTLCRIAERDGYYVEGQELHVSLFMFHYFANNKGAMEYHLRNAVRLAYEHDLLYAIADIEAYYPDAVNAVLCEYPDSFAERIRKNSNKIIDNYSRFTKKASITNVYERLSKSDFRYAFYAIEGYANKQVADICGVSERTVAKRYNDIYDKLGINSKKELISEMSIAFGNK